MVRSVDKKPTWRDFFEKNELDKIGNGEIEEEEDEESSADEAGGSDSDPSENNMDAGELMQIWETAFEGEEPELLQELQVAAVAAAAVPPETKEEKKRPPVEEPMKMKTSVMNGDLANLPYNFIVKPPVTLVYPGTIK